MRNSESVAISPVEQSPESAEYWTLSAIEDYSRVAIPMGERPDFIQHALATKAMVVAFSGDKLPPAAFSAALLHDVIDRFLNEDGPKYTSEKAAAAYETLMKVFNNLDTDYETKRYLAHILPDMVHTEKRIVATQKGYGK